MTFQGVHTMTIDTQTVLLALGKVGGSVDRISRHLALVRFDTPQTPLERWVAIDPQYPEAAAIATAASRSRLIDELETLQGG